MNITKEKLISRIAKAEQKDKASIHSFYNALENEINKIISSVTLEYDEDNPVTIKLFEGVSIVAYHVPDKLKKINYIKDSDNVVTVKGGIRVKANVTRNYQRKVNRKKFK